MRKKSIIRKNGFLFSENIIRVFGKIWYNGSNMKRALFLQGNQYSERVYGPVCAAAGRRLRRDSIIIYKG